VLSRAAPPALSQQIARLEQELGVQLLVRNRRQVTLTDAGLAFLENARDLLERRDEAIETARRAGRGDVGRLRVGFIGPTVYSVLPLVIRAHRSHHPDVDLVLEELTTAAQVEQLIVNRLDVGFVRLPLVNERLEVEQALTEPVTALLPEDHRLNGRTAIDLAELAAEPFITVSPAREPALADWYMNFFRQVGFTPRVVQEAHQIATVVGLVAAGTGVALAAASMANLYRPGVRYLSLRTPADARVGTGLVSRGGDQSPVLEAFRQTVRETLANYADPDLRG